MDEQSVLHHWASPFSSIVKHKQYIECLSTLYRVLLRKNYVVLLIIIILLPVPKMLRDKHAFPLCVSRKNSVDPLKRQISPNIFWKYLTINLPQPYLPRNCSSIPSRLRFFSLKAAVDSNVLTTALPPQTNALVICRRGCTEKREREREKVSHCTPQTSTSMYHIHRPYQSGAHQGPGLLWPLSLAPAVPLCLIRVPVRPSYHHGNLLLINNAAARGDPPGPEETGRLRRGGHGLWGMYTHSH